MQTFLSWLGILRRFAQKVGPYVLLEILLPGGTLLALLFFLCRRKPEIGRAAQRAVAVMIGTLAAVSSNVFGDPCGEERPSRCRNRVLQSGYRADGTG
jgi:hypothetical protein